MTLLQSTPSQMTQSISSDSPNCSNEHDAGWQDESRLIDCSPDETTWVNGLRRGDPFCYERLVREQTGTLLAVARRYLNEQDAQDAVQEAFIKAFEHIQTFRAASCLSTWLHRILINACLTRLRREKTRHKIFLESQTAAKEEQSDHLHATTSRPEQYSSEAEMRKIVRQCLARLPEAYRTVILLRDIDGFSGMETAQLLDISITLVKVRLHRARHALRTQLLSSLNRTQYVERSAQCLQDSRQLHR